MLAVNKAVSRRALSAGRGVWVPAFAGTTRWSWAWLRRVGAFLAAGFEQEPGAPLGLVDEQFEQLRGADVVVVVGKLVGLSQGGGHVLVVFHQFAQHLARRHVVFVVVL